MAPPATAGGRFTALRRGRRGWRAAGVRQERLAALSEFRRFCRLRQEAVAARLL